MNDVRTIPANDDDDLIAREHAASLREGIAEMLWFFCRNAEIGIEYARLADDDGLDYAMKRMRGYWLAASATMKDLREQFPPVEGRIRKEWRTSEGRR